MDLIVVLRVTMPKLRLPEPVMAGGAASISSISTCWATQRRAVRKLLTPSGRVPLAGHISKRICRRKRGKDPAWCGRAEDPAKRGQLMRLQKRHRPARDAAPRQTR